MPATTPRSSPRRPSCVVSSRRARASSSTATPRDGQDVAEIVDRAQAEVFEVAERRTTEDFVPLEELLQPTMDEIDSIASRGGISLGVPTGFAELDELTNGLHAGR